MQNLFAVVALVALLAGCMQSTQNGSNTTTEDFQRTCPAWVQGLSTSVFKEAFNRNSTDVSHEDQLGRGLLQDDNRPLDRVVLNFNPRQSGGGEEGQGIYVQDGQLVLQVARDDDGTFMNIYNPKDGPRGASNPGSEKMTFVPGQVYKDFTLQVDLADPHEAPHATSVTAHWTFIRDADHNPATPSQSQFFYTSLYMYRQC